MSPPKRCLICSNTSRSDPNMIFVQMPHPTKEAKSRRAWFAVYKDIVVYNESLNSYLCSNHFDLENDASNLEYYINKRMKKLLFKPHALPKPVSVVTIEPPSLTKRTSRIKRESVELDNDMNDATYIKEEPLDIDEHEIVNDPIDIKSELLDEESVPSPPPLVPAAQPAMQQGQQPLVINSFQVANPQLRSQLLRLAEQGRLRVVNVTNPESACTTPTLAVVGSDGISVNTAAGVIQTAMPRLTVPQLPRPERVMQLQSHPSQPGQQQTVRMINMQQAQVQAGMVVGGGQAQGQQVMNIRPLSAFSSATYPHAARPLPHVQQITVPLSALQSPTNPSILRHQLILPKAATPSTQAPSLVPLPMRSVFACGKCTELFYTTTERDKHIEIRHPGSLYAPGKPTQQHQLQLQLQHHGTGGGGGSKVAKEPVKKTGGYRGTTSPAGKGKVVKVAETDFTCEFCQIKLPTAQKAGHVATHETFKCVICHQTLEKRIYATHMMSHIEDRPIAQDNDPSPPTTTRKPKLNHLFRKRFPPRMTMLGIPPRPVEDRDDISIEVRKAVRNHPDVEENLDEYMISREKRTKPTVPDEKQKLYEMHTCGTCKKIFDSKFMLLSHQQRDHKTTKLTTNCIYCNQSVLRTSLYQHIRNDHTEKIFSCPKCSASFAHRYACERHIQYAHANENAADLRPKRNIKRVTAQVKESHKSSRNVNNVNTEVLTDDVIGMAAEDMDYDEDYPLSLLMQASRDNNNLMQQFERDGVEVGDIGYNEGDDRPEYVDITEYNAM